MTEKWNLSDPFVYQALMGLQNKTIAVQTTRGSVRGVLRNVMPDHIVVHMGGSPFYIRTDQIIWVQPEDQRMSQDPSDIG